MGRRGRETDGSGMVMMVRKALHKGVGLTQIQTQTMKAFIGIQHIIQTLRLMATGTILIQKRMNGGFGLMAP
jgi:hypothetical protein